MTSQAQIDNIKAYFVFQADEMPKISTTSPPPTTHPYKHFKMQLTKKVLALDTELGHAALTMKAAHFTAANKRAYTNPVSPGTSPSNPNMVVEI
mmetsp:Transcript_3318/g.3150  ORF Transcript_3318/g.3150 Transcript_3318/m.3150 type:complete len:94 (-) Transcript_3318:351-632(-)|eukprot:CAMPEP_0197830724 /NCGR_PEP_ID=MMETSP1437-20131217/7344_1 /TAXON_ID=49252 ORGANISM="Eucampia antarctica, Strain CCMP1452" /NCGR_SAMPLE_ID=MMETSP1437 /ASSEMBLY_ACC=CAM_ASM_001096 /LENGTH=93 /DNA_ID=CAMNT_0043433301 /DNA_START=160 /DNA_END=441 /DNA_ORIENTATION=-